MAPIKTNAIGHPIRFLTEWRHDPYQNYRKWPDPTACPDCGAIYRKGRWCWPDGKETGQAIRCPACQRTQDGNPAGYLTIHGTFYQQHLLEIDQLMSNLMDREKKEHPLKRLMGRVKNPDGTWLLTFTEPHLAVQLGNQLKRAYDGDLDIDYQTAAYEVRVRWGRDD